TPLVSSSTLIASNRVELILSLKHELLAVVIVCGMHPADVMHHLMEHCSRPSTYRNPCRCVQSRGIDVNLHVSRLCQPADRGVSKVPTAGPSGGRGLRSAAESSCIHFFCSGYLT